jgi:hypothetical protein
MAASERDRAGHDGGYGRGDKPVAAGVVAQPHLELAGSEQTGRDQPVQQDPIEARRHQPDARSR